MCWAGLLQVGCVWEPSAAAQIFGPSLERVLSSCLVDRARVASLERAIASGSGPESCISWLERDFFARAVWVFFARARSLSLVRASGCRPEGLSC